MVPRKPRSRAVTIAAEPVPTIADTAPACPIAEPTQEHASTSSETVTPKSAETTAAAIMDRLYLPEIINGALLQSDCSQWSNHAPDRGNSHLHADHRCS